MAALVMVFLYPIGSFVGGWLMAWLFNAVARRWGGVEMELDEPA